MTHEAFEKLLSDWLDEPSDASRARLDAAVEGDPARSAERDRWVRLAALIHACGQRRLSADWDQLGTRIATAISQEQERADGPLTDLLKGTLRLPAVNWTRVLERISSAVTAAEPDEQQAGALDLAAMAGALPPVDWDRVGQRIRAAVHRTEAPARFERSAAPAPLAIPTPRRRILRTTGWLVAAGAAAAAVALILIPTRTNGPTTKTTTVATIEIRPAASVALDDSTGQARVAMVLDEPGPANRNGTAASAVPDADTEDFYFAMDPDVTEAPIVAQSDAGDPF